jgi:hypothetical protein
MPGVASLAIYQGDDYAAVVTVMGDGDTPADLTGYTAQSQIRSGPADADPVIAATVNTAVVLPNFINLTISHTDTATLKGNYVWDLQLTAPDGTIQTILVGKVQVTPEVTR